MLLALNDGEDGNKWELLKTDNNFMCCVLCAVDESWAGPFAFLYSLRPPLTINKL